MPHRRAQLEPAVPEGPLKIGAALRERLREGYGARDLRADVLSGIVVGIVALPLAMALAIASGVPPQHGIYTSIVAGALIALLGGARTNVSGPTAAFVVLLAPVSARFGVGGLLIATFMAGFILVILGLSRMGRLIQFVPHPVTTGFTAGIAVVIAALQLKDFLGLTTGTLPEHLPERVLALARALPTAHGPDLAVGAFTLGVLVVWPKIARRIPGPLIAMALGGGLAYALSRLVDGFHVDTISTRFSYVAGGATLHGIPRTPPSFAWPWSWPGPGGEPIEPSLGLLRQLIGPAFAIAALGAIESLLCAVVADGMAGTKHDPDVELFAQGVGNLVAPLFGGIAATGAIARTATGIRAGARSPISAIVHAIFVLAAVLLLAPLLGFLPMASLAALLLVVAWNMSDARHFVKVVRVAPRSDLIVLLTCFSLTVAFDMVVSVGVGIVLAALLFMRRMAEISGARISEDYHPHLKDPLLKDVVVYEIGGPLFFGAAEKAISTIERVRGKARVVILGMDRVTVIDVTGLVALESAIERLQAHGTFVVMAGVLPQPRETLAKAGLVEEPGRLAICGDDDEALLVVRVYLGMQEATPAAAVHLEPAR
jgi:SulP family sulfate permease